jgi:hypothetical protein
VSFFILLVEKFAVIHQLADGRHGVRRNLHHIHALVARRFHRVEEGHHAKLIPFVVDHADFPSANALVDSKTYRTTSFSDKPTSRPRPERVPYGSLRNSTH